MVTSFGYLTIPAVALLSTAFLGFVRVGEEIENPFGYGKLEGGFQISNTLKLSNSLFVLGLFKISMILIWITFVIKSLLPS